MGDLGSAPESKTFVVGINYMSESCGRVSKPISFSDMISMSMVGVVREYSIRAIQEIGGSLVKTDWSTMPYRIPFLVKVSGKVQTKSGAGVGNVTISYCHIDTTTGVDSVVTGYCPLISFVTDKFGEYSGEIRVSNKDWTNSAEHFNVTASLVDRNGITHTFDTPFREITAYHLVSSIVDFNDNTTISVRGKVTYEPLNVDNAVCPFSDLELKVRDDGGTETPMKSDADGMFTFSTTQGAGFNFIIPAFNGRSWRVVLKSSSKTWTEGVEYRQSVMNGTMSISIDKTNSFDDIEVAVYDISMQVVNVGMFGGLGKAYLDVGASTTFDLIPVDAKCTYKKTVNMANNYFEDQVPAMNYMVVLTASPNVPVVGTSNPRNGFNPSGRYYCDSSKAPMTYFTEVNQLTQPLTIDVVNSTYIYRVEYLYF